MDVTNKLIDPKIEEMPAKWIEKMAKSTALLSSWEDKGGYKVQPAPGPSPIKADTNKQAIEGGNNQNDTLFNLG
jgi:hypothetical protein